jgi:formate dehydrogenase major subunit
VAGLAASFGSGAMTNSIKEIADAEVLFVIGSNTTEAHPVISYFMKRAVKKGGTLIVNDPRKIDLTRWAQLHVQHRVGSDVAYLNGLIHEIFANGWENRAFLEQNTENPDAIREWVKPYTPEMASTICGVPPETIRKVARILGTAKSVSVCYTLGITEHICGTDNVKTIANLQMVLGNIGKYAAGVNPLRGQNNVQGACDMGALPNVYHNYQAADNPDVIRKFEQAWGVTGLPTKAGYKMPTMLHKALEGKTKVLYCVGDNTVQTEPHMAHTIKELQALEFFVVCDIFPNITTPYADVIFPDTCWGEEEGTFSNSERRVQRVRAALKAPGEARSHWWVLQELGKRLGYDMGFSTSESVWEDMRKTSTSYAGITYGRIASLGLQWPCPTLEHPGTAFLHKDGKFTRGKGLFHKIEYIPPAEQVDAEYPLVLSTGRRLWHYHTGTQTRNSEGLSDLFPEELMEISPADAQRLGIQTGDLVEASSRRGTIRLRAWVTERSPTGVCWCAFHFHEACANVLTNDAFDSVTETAEYKVCAIRVRKIEDGTLGIPQGKLLRQARP